MSISSELLTLQNTKTAIRTAINNKGGSVGASDTFASYATAITNLPSGGSGNPLLESIDVSDFTGTTFNRAASYITDVTIPNSVTSIGSYAFQYYSSLTSVTIPSGVTSIGNYAFQSCSSLTSINIPSGVTSIGANTFDSCSSLTSVTIPSGVTSIGDRSFKSSGLTNINIPSGVTSIEREAFNGCSSLQTVIVNAITPPTLGNNVFNNTNDCPIYVPAASVDTYKAASNWSTYASRIFAIEQVATVDGNPVYNYELGMTLTTMIRSTEMAKMPTGTSLELAEGIVSVDGETAFANYTNLTLPSTFATFGDEEMLDGPTTLICKAATPPAALHNNIGGANLTAIYVPSANVTDYQSASGWSTYSAITYPLYEVATVDGKSVYNANLGETGQVTTMTSAMLAALPTGNSVKFSDGIDTFSGQIGAYEQVTLPASGLTQLEFTVASPINAATETLTVPFNALLPNIVVANDTLGGAGLTEIILDTDMCGVPYSSAVDALKATAGFTTFADIIKAKPEDYMVITNLDVDPAPNGVITMSLAHAEQDTESQSPDALICYAPFTICKPSFAVDGETSNGTYTDSRGRTATYTPSLGSANIYNGDTLIASDMSIEVDNSGIGQDWDSANDMWSIMVYTDSSGSGTDVVTLQPGMRVECFIDEIKYDYDSEASCTPMAHSYITINVTA